MMLRNDAASDHAEPNRIHGFTFQKSRILSPS